MNFLIIGLSHKTAPIELRERLHFPEDRWPDLLKTVHEESAEVLFLSTCNRAEFWVVPKESDDQKVLSAVEKIFGESISARHLYLKRGSEAIVHVFRVTASLDSMVVGETQISHQVKQSYQFSVTQGTVGKILHRLVHRALGVAKRVRTETAIGEHPVSVSYAAVVLAEKVFGALAGKKVLLIGAGEMGELACEHFQKRGADLVISNRTLAKADELARRFGCGVTPFETMAQSLDQFDVVLTSIAVDQPLLTVAILKPVMTRRKNRAMFVIDIAVPRNVAPEVNGLDNLFLYNIDDLQGIVSKNLQKRSEEVHEADQIIAEELEKTISDLGSYEVIPTIQQLTRKFESIRQVELAKHFNGVLTPAQKETLEACTQAIVNKILHDPIVTIKREAQSANSYRDILKKLFKLEG